MKAKHKQRPGPSVPPPAPPPPPVLEADVLDRVLPAAVFLLTALAFLPALRNGFVNWDDPTNILDNKNYRGLGWPQLHWIFTKSWGYMGNYEPVTWLVHALTYLVAGMRPAGYHAAGIFWHALAAALFYFFSLRLLAAAASPQPGAARGLKLAAAASALLFSLHPLRAEVVAWVSGQHHALSGSLLLGALLLHLKALEAGAPGWARPASVALYALSLLSFPMGMTLPAVLILLDAYPLRRLQDPRSAQARALYWEKAPYAVLALAGAVVAAKSRTNATDLTNLQAFALLPRIFQASYCVLLYLRNVLFPLRLSPLYEVPADWTAYSWPFPASAAAVLALTAGVWLKRRERPGLAAAYFSFLIVLSPVLASSQAGKQFAADRYTYLAAMGWALLAGGGLWALARSASPRLRPAAAACALTLALYGALSAKQSMLWHDTETLWNHALSVNPELVTAHTDLGAWLAEHERRPEALEHYKAALKVRPDSADANLNMGAALADEGRWDEALPHYYKTLEVNPKSDAAHNNLGAALVHKGQAEEGIAEYRKALEINPDYVKAMNNLAKALGESGRGEEAVKIYKRALETDPGNLDAHINLAVEYRRQGRREEGLAQNQEAARLYPDNAETVNGLGVALAQAGKTQEAIELFKKALALNPKLENAENNWGNALRLQGRLEEAVEHYAKAVKLNPAKSDAQNNWANVLRMQGKTEAAMERWRAGIKAGPENLELRNNLAMTLASQGRMEEAVAELRAALRVRPDAASHNNLGSALSRMGRLEESEAEYREALKLRPNFFDARQNLGLALARQKRYAEAVAELREALKLRPGDPGVLDSLSKLEKP